MTTAGTAPARRGRPPQISADDIIGAASAQLDTEWTVASVAAELGVSDAAIYRYFPSKRALLVAVAVRHFSPPLDAGASGWRSLMSETARFWYSLLLRYPVFLDIESWIGDDTHETLSAIDQLFGALLEAGFEPLDAAIVLGSAAAVAREFARTELAARRTNSNPQTVTWDPQEFTTLSQVSAAMPASGDGVFERALDMVLDGAAQRLKGSAGG